jgi:hypothetical protein
MKKQEIPQDPSALDKFTKEVCYAVDESGKYITGLSRGWEIKADALGVTWQDIEQRIEDARRKVNNGEKSPIYFYMERSLMDLEIMASYTGFWQWQIKRHMKPRVFQKLSNKSLQKYADIFEVSIENLKNINCAN